MMGVEDQFKHEASPPLCVPTTAMITTNSLIGKYKCIRNK